MRGFCRAGKMALTMKELQEKEDKYHEAVKDIKYLEDIASTLLLLGDKNTKTTRMMATIRTKYNLSKRE